MAVKIGNTAGLTSQGASTLNIAQDADELEAFGKQYGVGNYAEGMQIAIDGNDTIYTVSNSAGGVLTFDPVLSADVADDTPVYKVYEGAHGTTAAHCRKRLLGYI